MNRRALFATVLLVATPVVCSFAADDAASRRPQDGAAPTATVGAPAPTETPVATDNLQAARKPEESPFSEVKILPSF